VGYFLGAYAAGVYLGINYADKIIKIKAYKWPLLITFIVTSIATFACYQLNLEFYEFISYRESLVYLQKMSIALLALLWFQQRESHSSAWLNTLATYAFPIYFIHAYFEVAFFQTVFADKADSYSFIALLMYGLLVGIAVLVTAALISIGIKKLIPKYSRYFIGT
jgi:membrane-bound acyltransferase YfiQ involved in biofilm formation